MWATWLGLALAAPLEVDFKVAATVLADEQYLAQLWVPGIARVDLSPGEHEITALIQGVARRFHITMPDAPMRVIIGATGLSAEQIERPPAAVVETVMVKWQCAAGEAVMVTLDRDRFVISPGRPRTIGVPPGDHKFSVRSVDGVNVYAQGTLQAAADGMIQVAAGMLPEMSGDGLRFLGR
jgi:hypothetical protein